MNIKNWLSFKEVILVVIVVGIGLSLRLANLNAPLYFDETCTWAFARRTPFAKMWMTALSDPTPPLYYAIVHFIIRFLGDTRVFMRIPSVFFGMLILPGTYWCMRQGDFNKKDGMYATLLVAVSSMLVYYSQDLRAYSMLAFLGSFSVVLLLRCLKRPTLANNLFYAVTVCIMSYTHYYGFLLLAAQFICIILYRRWQTLLLSFLASALVVIPLFIRIIEGKFTYSDAIDRVSNWGAVIALINMLNVGTVYLWAITGLQPSPRVAYPNFSMNLAISIAGLVVFTIIFVFGFTKLKQYTFEQRQFMMILGICIVVPAILALLAGSPLSPKPQWLLRGLIYIWPLYYMVVVVACSKSRFKGFFITIIVLINCLSLYPYYTMFSRCKEATALEQLNYRTTNNDLVVANPQYFYEVINYYYHGNAQRAGYERTKGWVDLKKMQESDKPFRDAQSVPVTVPPHTSGDVYFFWWIDDSECLRPFPQNRIFVYDGEKNSWKRYEIQK